MKTQNDSYSLSTLEMLREKINLKSEYQRPEVWKRSQKQLLIDSILRGYDIPKIYVKQENAGSQYKYEVIDGQQRLTSIWNFFDGDFGLPKDAEPINGVKCASQTYQDLDTTLQLYFNDYQIDVVIVTDAIQDDEMDEIGDLFLRLQNGTPLNAQEKRNAMPGNMRDFIKELVKHKFFESYASANYRYAHDQLAAKLSLLEFSFHKTDSVTNITSSDLDRFYKEQNNFEMQGVVAQNIERVLDYLQRAFPIENPELVHHSVITLYCLASKLIKHNRADETEKLFHKWFIEFEEKRKKNDALKDDGEKDPTLQEYKFCIVSSSESQKRIEKRLKILEDSFFGANPNIEKI